VTSCSIRQVILVVVKYSFIMVLLARWNALSQAQRSAAFHLKQDYAPPLDSMDAKPFPEFSSLDAKEYAIIVAGRLCLRKLQLVAGDLNLRNKVIDFLRATAGPKTPATY
jgi:hypothetical protein